MTLLSVLGGLTAAATVAATARGIVARRRALAAVAPELRHPLLYLPLSITNTTALAIARRRNLPGGTLRPGVRCDTHTVPVPAGGAPVTVLSYQTPDRSTPSAALLWIHGGGTIIGAADMADGWCSRVAAELGILVISVDYRLAPENPYPAGLDDCYHALRWLHDHAEDLGVHPDRIAVGGESAGGGLAATLAQRAGDTGVPVAFQALVYPMLDDRTVLRPTPSIPFLPPWTYKSNRFGWTCYLGHPPAYADDRPYIAAARRSDLTGLPPAWIGVGDLDLFHTEDIDYAHRLNQAGVACEVVEVPGMYHGADLLRGNAASMIGFRASLIHALKTALVQPHRGDLPVN
jgi:acetyl esterase/lipase